MTIKRFILTLGFLAMVCLTGYSQSAEITPFAGYQFGGTMNFYEGQLKGEGGLNYGVVIDIPLRDIMFAELYWSQMQESYRWDSYTYGIDVLNYDINTNYFQVGAGKQDFLGSSDKVMGFGSMTMGAVWFDPKDETVQDTWRFSMTLGGGLKVFFSERVGIRLQGRMLLPMYWGGSSFYYGMGGGGVTVSSYSCLIQGDFTGGLIIKVGK